MCPLFDYAAYAEARAQAIMEKKQEVSSKHTYTEYAAARAPVKKKMKDIFYGGGGEENLMKNLFQTI